jgi:hypothetical protein
MAKHKAPSRERDVDPGFDGAVKKLEHAVKRVGHGRVFLAVEVDDQGHVISSAIAADRLTTEDIAYIMRELPRGAK